MAKKHVLEGLIKWSTRDPWVDRFEGVLEEHLLPTCDETGLEAEEIVSTIGEDLFMSTVWACAFEDFLTREYEDVGNVVDDYLKRRGWKETASVRTYIAALRSSTMSLYEVSDVVPGESFRARDLVRGGEPVLISERSATRTLKQWDRIAARVVQVGSKSQIGGGVLPLEHRSSEDFLEGWRGFGQLSLDDKRKIMEDATGESFDAAELTDRSPTEMLRSSASVFTTFWLIDTINEIEGPETPDLHNFEGDELLLCEARYPLAAGTMDDDIRAVLGARPEFRETSATSWSWIDIKAPVAGPGETSQESLRFETRTDDGALVLGHVALEDRTLMLSVNSSRRCDLGCTLLSELLGTRLGPPLINTETVEQMIGSVASGVPEQPDISDEERRAVIHDYLDRYYRDVLDQPVPMLGDLSPRAAVKTENGPAKVADWIKMLENRTARSADHNSAMGSYSFGWVWTELGIGDLRR